MAHWRAGASAFDDIDDGAAVSPAGLVGGLKASLATVPVDVPDGLYELRIDEETLHLEVLDGVLRTGTGGAGRPDGVLATDLITAWRLLRGSLTIPDVPEDAIEITGSVSALSHLLDALRVAATA